MSLPTLGVSKHITTLPISKREVEFRPFLVKEEKILIIADSSGKESDMEMAVSRIVENCTFSKVQAGGLCQADLEWLLLQIRIHSKGGTAELVFQCINPVDTLDKNGNPTGEKHECSFKNEINADLNTVEITNGNKSDVIELTDSIGIKMKAPTISVLRAVDKLNESEVEAAFTRVLACIESIYDGEEVWLAKDLKREEINTFLESFTDKQFDNVKEWVENLPVMKLKVDYVCANCGAKDTIVIEGIDNFFG